MEQPVLESKRVNLEEVLRAKNFRISQKHYEQFGVLFAPKSYAEFAAILQALETSNVRFMGWRGQSDIDWRVDCSAVRRITNFDKDFRQATKDLNAEMQEVIKPFWDMSLETKVSIYEEWLLNEARLKGYHRHHNRELSELEILASIQHYGGATRLFDFSENVLVSLWFASRSHPNSEGLILGFEHDPYRLLDRADYIDKPMSELFKLHEGSKLFKSSNIAWKPQYLFERMRMQQSLFLFGEVYSGPWSSLTPYDFNYHRIEIDPARAPATSPLKAASQLGRFFACAVTTDLKEQLNGMWSHIFGYDVHTMFPDLEGFSTYNGTQQDIDLDIFNLPSPRKLRSELR